MVFFKSIIIPSRKGKEARILKTLTNAENTVIWFLPKHVFWKELEYIYLIPGADSSIPLSWMSKRMSYGERSCSSKTFSIRHKSMWPERWCREVSTGMFVWAAKVTVCFSVCTVWNCMWMQLDHIDSCNGEYANNTMIFLHPTSCVGRSRDGKWSSVVKSYWATNFSNVK